MGWSLGRLPRWSVHLLLLGSILSYAVVVRTLTLNRPFDRNAEGLGSYYGILARNYFRHSIADTWLVPVQSLAISDKANPTFYPNHPPLVPLFIAGSYWLFNGEAGSDDWVPPEWQTRLPTALFTLGCIVLIYAMVNRRAGPRAAAVAAALFAGVPMTIHYGGAADVINTQLVFFALLTIAAYLRFHAAPSATRLALLSTAFVPAGLTDWPAYYLIVVLFLHYVFTHPVRKWAWIIAFGSFGAILFLVVYAQIAFVIDDWRWMARPFFRRSLESQNDAGEAFTFRQWLGMVFWRNRVWHTPILMIAAGMFVMCLIWRRNAGSSARLARLLVAWAVVHVAVGQQGVYQHDWWWWPTTPALVVSAALIIEFACLAIERGGIQSWKASTSLAVLLVVFIAWNSAATLLASPDRASDGRQYSPKQLGQAIRSAVAPNTSVLLAERDPDTVPLWYYADRPLVQEVWNIETVDRMATDPRQALLPWGGQQDWPHPAGAVVFPVAYLEERESFVEQLRARYPYRETRDGKFLIFDLGLGKKRPDPRNKRARRLSAVSRLN